GVCPPSRTVLTASSSLCRATITATSVWQRIALLRSTMGPIASWTALSCWLTPSIPLNVSRFWTSWKSGSRYGPISGAFAPPPCGIHWAAPGGQLLPALGLHELGPALVEIAEIILTGPCLGEIRHHPGEPQAVPCEIVDFKPHALLVAVGIAPRNGPPA